MKRTPALFLSLLIPLFTCVYAQPEKPIITIRADLDRAVLPAEQRQTVVVKISLDAALPPKQTDRAPVNLCLVLDRSGSMSGRKIENARQAALEALSRLGKDDTLSLITYHSAVETLFPASKVENIETVQALIQGISSGGDTALFGGVSQGASELRKLAADQPKGMVHRMILLSDGLANIGPSSTEELGRLGTSLMKEGISVTTVGLGNDFNEDLMTTLSKRSDGNTYFVENSNDLARIFKEEIGDVLNVVARDVRLHIRCPEGVRPVRSIGREATIQGQKIELNLNQLYGGQEKFLLLELEVPAGDKGTVPLLEAEVSFHNVVTQTDEKKTTKATARFSQDLDVIAKSVNEEVQVNYYSNQSALAKDEAIARWEAGDEAGAKQILLSNSVILKQAASTYALPVLELEAGNLEKKHRDLQEEGLTKYNRKSLRTEALQQSNQQRVQQNF